VGGSDFVVVCVCQRFRGESVLFWLFGGGGRGELCGFSSPLERKGKERTGKEIKNLEIGKLFISRDPWVAKLAPDSETYFCPVGVLAQEGLPGVNVRCRG